MLAYWLLIFINIAVPLQSSPDNVQYESVLVAMLQDQVDSNGEEETEAGDGKIFLFLSSPTGDKVVKIRAKLNTHLNSLCYVYSNVTVSSPDITWQNIAVQLYWKLCDLFFQNTDYNRIRCTKGCVILHNLNLTLEELQFQDKDTIYMYEVLAVYEADGREEWLCAWFLFSKQNSFFYELMPTM